VGTVTSKGDVLPCSDFGEGLNVRDMSLDEIWRSPRFHELRRRVHTWRDLRFYFDSSIP